jgi:hypothetical protein
VTVTVDATASAADLFGKLKATPSSRGVAFTFFPHSRRAGRRAADYQATGA